MYEILLKIKSFETAFPKRLYISYTHISDLHNIQITTEKTITKFHGIQVIPGTK